jgi:hypothetical protein
MLMRRQKQLHSRVRIAWIRQTARDSSPDKEAATAGTAEITVITAALSQETETARIRAVSVQTVAREAAIRAALADAAQDLDRAAAQQRLQHPVREQDPVQRMADAAELPEDPRAKDSLISIETIIRER